MAAPGSYSDVDYFIRDDIIIWGSGMRYLFSWYAICIYSFSLIVISILPLKAPLELSFPFIDKVVHCLIYAGLSFTAVNTLYRRRVAYPRFFSFSYAFSFGLVMELVQFFIPYRSYDPADIFFNFLGGILGCLLIISRHKDF